MSLQQVDDKSTESFKLTQGLYLYFEGEIYFQYRDYQKAIESLESSLGIMEGELKLDTNLARCYNTLGNLLLWTWQTGESPRVLQQGT